MSHTPPGALTTEIAAQVASLTAGTNLFCSTVRSPDASVPVNSVFVWGNAGPEPLRTMGEPDEIRRELVSVRVRNATYATGEALARSIQNNLRAASIATYLETKMMGGGPDALGEDPDGSHYFGLLYVMTYISD